MADNSVKNDALPEDPRPLSVRNEPKNVDEPIDAQESDDPVQVIQNDIPAPNEDLKFRRMLKNISEELTDKNLVKLRDYLSCEFGNAFLDKIKKPEELSIIILEERHWLTKDNLLKLQAALRNIGRMDLEKVAAEYALTIDNVLCPNQPSESVLPEMAGNSFESDARHKPPSPVNVQHEPQTVDQYIGEQRREVLEPTTQQDFQLPTEDLGFRGMVTEENVENLKFLFSDIQAPMEDYELKQMLLKLSKELTDEDLEKLKFRFSGGSGNGVQENIKKPVQLFATLVERHWITSNNMIIFQTALRDIGRLDLVRVTAEFAQMMDNDQPSESGYTSVRLHLWDRNYNYNYNIQMIHTRFQELVGCAPEDIVIVGLDYMN